jgi:hypothetical protein
LKSRMLNRLPKNLSASVFSRSFVVFNPYPDQKKIMHRFLSAVPFVALVGALALTALMWRLLMYGFVLSLLIVIVGLNLIIIEEAPEIYMNTKTFVRAVQDDKSLATGDMKVLQLIKKLTPKLGNYYLCLSTLFFVFSVALPYVSSSAPAFWSGLVNLIARASGQNGTVVLEAATFVLGLNLALFQFVAFKIKNMIFKYEIE